MTIIGGGDGPTTVFLTSGTGWFSIFGLIITVLMLIPNIIYMLKHRDAQNRCTNRAVNILEQVGRYGCMFLMVFNIGIFEPGFASVEAFLIYLAGNAVLLLAYFVFWLIYSKRSGLFPALMLAILPTLIFLLCGVTLRHILLALFAVLFGVFHIYITVINAREGE